MAISTLTGVGTNQAVAAMRLYSSRAGKSEQLNKSLLVTLKSDCEDCQQPDEVSISDEARAILEEHAVSKLVQAELSEAELEQLAELKKRDIEVRSHEQAHLTAAGRYASGGPSYTYEEGPDGRHYAVEGEVPIDASPVVNDPEATIEKARTIRRAATAPAEPSAQDQAIAAKALQMEVQAQQNLREQEQSNHPLKTGTGIST